MAVLSSVFLILAFGVIFFFALPLFNEIREHSQSIITKNLELDYFQQDLIQAREFELLKGSMEWNSQSINNAFANAQAPINLIKFWENSAKDCGLAIDISSVPAPAGSSAKWKILYFRIAVTGNFAKTLNFIEKIENGPYLTQIQGISSSQNIDGVKTDLKITAFAN